MEGKNYYNPEGDFDRAAQDFKDPQEKDEYGDVYNKSHPRA